MQASHLHPLLIIDTNIAPRSLYTDTRIEHIKGGCKEGLASAFSIGICKKNLMNVQESHSYERKPSRTPAATAEPITPATLGPMACMRR